MMRSRGCLDGTGRDLPISLSSRKAATVVRTDRSTASPRCRKAPTLICTDDSPAFSFFIEPRNFGFGLLVGAAAGGAATIVCVRRDLLPSKRLPLLL